MHNRSYNLEIHLVTVKTMRTIAHIFVAFSEKLNFNPNFWSYYFYLSDLNLNNFQVCLYGDKCDDMISGSTQHSTISPVPYLLANLCPPVMDVMTSIHLKVGYQIKKILYLFPKVVNCMWINHCFAKNLDSLHCNLSKCSPFFVKWRTYA